MINKKNKDYYIYIIRCEDNSLYTGITTDLERRMKEHLERGKRGAKYTSSHIAKEMEIAWKTNNKKKASKLEYHPKKLEQLLSNKIEYKEYLHIKIKS